jgi:hypothetical protein
MFDYPMFDYPMFDYPMFDYPMFTFLVSFPCQPRTAANEVSGRYSPVHITCTDKFSERVGLSGYP